MSTAPPSDEIFSSLLKALTRLRIRQFARSLRLRKPFAPVSPGRRWLGGFLVPASPKYCERVLSLCLQRVRESLRSERSSSRLEDAGVSRAGAETTDL